MQRRPGNPIGRRVAPKYHITLAEFSPLGSASHAPMKKSARPSPLISPASLTNEPAELLSIKPLSPSKSWNISLASTLTRGGFRSARMEASYLVGPGRSSTIPVSDWSETRWENREILAQFCRNPLWPDVNEARTDIEMSVMTQQDAVKVSIVIKAFNEEEDIEASIRSALAAIERVGGEVILADSVSTDNTVSIARQFPVNIVQLKNIEDRRCGVGPQLGYQSARGQYVYILDGDMEMDPDFLLVAIEAMENNPGLGGVGGLIEELSTASYQFRGHKRRKSKEILGEVKWLEGGGLYRRQALEQVHYFSNRNLHAYEEQDLDLRLNHADWLCVAPAGTKLVASRLFREELGVA